MKFFVFLLCWVLAKAVEFKPKIIGGEEAKVGEFPFLVGIYVDDVFLCAGVLIRENLVLTSAYCASLKIDDDYDWSVVAGLHNKTDLKSNGLQRQVVTGVILHPDWVSNGRWHSADIGVIHVENNFTLSNRVQKIYLPVSTDVVGEGLSGTIVGWGSTNASNWRSRPDNPQKVEVSIVSNKTCSDVYSSLRGFNENLQFCAGNEQKDACLEESGAPFLLGQAKTLYGLVSHGGICENTTFTEGSIYTRIPPYLSWIEGELRKEPPPPPPTTTTTTRRPSEGTTDSGSSITVKLTLLTLLFPFVMQFTSILR